jgi:hypothetical protein
MLIVLTVAACEASPTSVSVRLEGSSDCEDSAVTLLTTPRLGEGEPSIERAQATLPWETTRTLSSKTELHLVATAPTCRRITCTLVVEGREVTRVVGTPWQERGATTACVWRAP